jgi:hypothetical protein
MSTDGRYFIFSGHAVGVAAQFHKLDQLQNLNHRIPTLGASVLPATGGVSHGSAANYTYAVEVPRRRTLIQVDRVATKAEGRTYKDRWETEVETEIDGVRVLDKLEIGSVRLHMLAVRDANSEDCEATKVTTRGSHIEGLRMGGVTARVTLDPDALENCGSKEQLARWYREKSSDWRETHGRRFATDPKAADAREVNGRIKFSLVRDIELSGDQDPEHKVYVLEDRYTIKWDGFGRIILGEGSVKGCDRRVTMVRLAMGSDGGGSGSVGDAGSNGQIGP